MTGRMKILNNKELEMLQFTHLAEECNISHFISTRRGGVSTGNYASFNLGEYCGDNPECVSENRTLLSSALGLSEDRLFAAHQLHGDKIAVLDKAYLALSCEQQREMLHGVDALITAEANVCVAVSTADCVPVLLYAPDKKVVAAVHAGWRGTVLQIVSKTLQYMKETFGCEIAHMKAGIGPSIGLEAFEVGEEVVEAFAASGLPLHSIMKRNTQTGKAHIDLWHANQWQMQTAGVLSENIETAGICTYTNQEDFFSARRLGIASGRMLTGIFIQH
ncbi:YfiH family protein [Parabacteroides sp. PF5-5]|uniref:peptidoglycan editing factor PgeF n=1 Tax=unclassified Parabacteroides TaxID=2649774 RepID=UPI00247378FC|nr:MULTISPECIES: peptidoglycan editing factor PgeF [unclassified Parabacteroides]MDH6305316.1 YfiH family protein [Parabacteroides sp. PH5-39]MDH6316669.1 YfiH family protein [Parabacteroides sp. PF5-13]MDH6320151.1 YfiH family protein [Parabacteroides sp. PH5-13]MDH6323906.1 YfiH family protein [Parabacteroides sp. PH5-8]MDH6327828.1 YfiH family protein [Parabacteroides sp. PH5-41]